MYLILFLLFLLMVIPQVWVKWVMHKHGKNIETMPGTGGELAQHLLEKFEMQDYKVEVTSKNNDHFSPADKTVRLGPKNFDGKSLTAIAVAAHEVGHAIQHFKNDRVFQLRARYQPMATLFTSAGLWILRGLPLIAFLIKAPAAIMAIVMISLFMQLIGALAYLFVLPEEWDASFDKALPILVRGNFIPDQHQAAVRQVLKAAALTYFAAAMANILNIGRLFLIFRR